MYLPPCMNTIVGCYSRGINDIFQNKEPWQIVTITTTSTLAMVWLWNFVHQDESKCYLILNIYFCI